MVELQHRHFVYIASIIRGLPQGVFDAATVEQRFASGSAQTTYDDGRVRNRDLNTRRPVKLQPRHREFIAGVIRDLPQGVFNRALVALSFADRLNHTNFKFSRSRFLAAAAPDEFGEDT